MENNPQQASEDLSLYGLFSLLFRNWLIISVFGFLLAIIAAVWAIGQPNIYKPETLLMPATDSSGGLGGLAGSLGGLGGMASLAGISLPESGGDNTKLALALLESYDFLGEFIENNDMLVPLMASEGWDLASDTLIINNDIYDTKNKKWVRSVKLPLKAKPSTQEAYKALLKLLSVEKEQKSKFVRIAIEFYSPTLATLWTNKLVESLNDRLRQVDMAQADKSINYLNELIKESPQVSLQQVFSGLLEEQIKSKMLTQVRDDYVFKVVDSAIVPETKHAPSRALIVIVAGFLGGILGIIIVLFRSGRASHKLSNQA